MCSHANCSKVQDAYTLRCIPQIHGIAHDTIAFVEGILTTECNSGTDNPMIFADLPFENNKLRSHSIGDNEIIRRNSAESQFSVHDSEVYPDEMGVIISGGNFHGEYPAKACDYLAIGVHELASVSERRIERMVNPHLSGLPAFLVQNGGLNSGFMISHCTAAALVSENKVLCHPASVDSLSTSAAQEDHVSMGGMSARKALMVVSNVEYVLGIELMTAVQALEFSSPMHTTPALEEVHKLVRSVVKPWDGDRIMNIDIDACVKLVRDNKVWEAVKPFLNE